MSERCVTLDIRRGERVAIVGESGCGKTTLLKILLGIERPEEGEGRDSVYFWQEHSWIIPG